MERTEKLQYKYLLPLCALLFCPQVLSEVRVFEAKVGSQDLQQIQERMTPEVYLFSAAGELKLRTFGLNGRIIGDVIEVLKNNKTLHKELSTEQLDKKIEEFQTVAANNLRNYLKKKGVSRTEYSNKVSSQNEQIAKSIKLPMFSEMEIVKHIQNTDIDANRLNMIADDEQSYLLVTYSADWCEPCHILNKELLIYFQEEQQNIDLNWVKLTR